MTELKPCPFCGGNVKLEDREFDDYAGSSFQNAFAIIECKKCGISMSAYPKRGYGASDEQKRKLVIKWNKRAYEE